MKVWQKQIPIILVLLSFGVIYALISLVNHYVFRTGALDLGMFNNAIYSFSRLEPNYFSLDQVGRDLNYFGDHFSPVTVLFSPLRYLFGTYTLLLVQIAAILAGGAGIYKYACCFFNRKISLLISIHFLSIWGIYSALSFDYHNNVIAAMLLPWLFYAYERKEKGWVILIVVLMLICKENIGLWVAFIFGALGLKELFRSGQRQWSAIKFDFLLMLASMIYFIVVIVWIMPALQPDQQNQMARYAHLGDTPMEILSVAFHQPLYFMSLFFQSPYSDPISFGIKGEFYFMLLVSGGILLLFNPYYVVMLIPVLTWKMLSSNYGFWGINGHYSIELVPIISIGVIEFLKKRDDRKRYILLTLLLLSTACFTLLGMEKQHTPWYDNTNVAFYRKAHYQTTLDIKEINQAIKVIPDKAIVSASSPIAPHLAFREKIYHYPIIKDAEYIVLLLNGRYYPLSESSFYREAAKIYNRNGYKVIYSSADLLIIKRQD